MMNRIYKIQTNMLNNGNVGNINNESIGKDIEVIINRLYKGEKIAELYHGGIYVGKENKKNDLKHYLAVAFTSDRIILGQKFAKENWIEQKDGSVCREFVKTIPLSDVTDIESYFSEGDKFVDVITKDFTFTLVPYQDITEDLTPRLVQAVEKYISNNTKIERLLKVRELHDTHKLNDERFIYHVYRILD